MNRRSGVSFFSTYGTDHDLRKFYITYALSILCHVIFFAVLIGVPQRAPEKKFASDVINVSMVSVPDESPSAKSASRAEQPKTPRKAAKSETAPVKPASEKAVSTAPHQVKEKVSLKKQTIKPSKMVKSALEALEKTVEASAPDPLKEALDRLEQEVGKTEAMDRIKDKVDLEKTEEGGSVSREGGLGTQKMLASIDIYRLEIAYKVQRNWAFSGQLAGDAPDLQASLVFKVMPNGEIKDVFFTDRSGSDFLDESAYKAILKSNPVDPHPAGVNKAYVNVGLRFTPEGVK
jgi:colicin import membrane protein